MISDEQYKVIMQILDQPNNDMLLCSLKQVENEARYEMKKIINEKDKLLAEALIVLTDAYHFCQREDCDGDMLHPTLALKISKVITNIRK